MIRTEAELKAKIAAYEEKKAKREFLVQEEKPAEIEKPKKTRKKREFLVQEENNSFSFEKPEEEKFEEHKEFIPEEE